MALMEPLTCSRCGTRHAVEAKFCDACGAGLGPTLESDPRPQPPPQLADKIRGSRLALEGERKQVTVLFGDVTGSMDLAEQIDPEEWTRIMGRFFTILSEGVHRFEGTVDKFTGDGIMAIFGAPIAHEDHAQRACYAALHLRDQLATYATELRRAQGLSFSVRMGLNSGEVIVGTIGEDLAMEYTAIGHTVGLAQRMESLAEPGKIYVTQDTATLVGGYLALEDLGEFQVKGASAVMHVHELTGIGGARGRLDVSRARGFSRFVGRTDEVRALESAHERALAGEPQVIGIVGEAGVGKSRLCHEFAQHVRASGTPVYHASGHAHTKSVPLMPVLEFMRAYFDVSEQDSEQTARERIAGKLLLLDETFAEDLPLMFDFLAVPDPERPSPRMDPEARQRRLLRLIKRLTRAQSTRVPGVSVFEDLHWIDPASETFLANHIEAGQGTRSLTILNFRPDYHAAWMSKSYYRQIALAPLGPEAIEELLADLLGSDPSLDGVAELIRRRTGGNPFFIEEIVQSLVEGGNLQGERSSYRLVRAVEETAVPASVQTVLSARIDRLAKREKRVLQAAAVIGKEFPEPVLRPVVELEGSELDEALRELVASEFVYELELYPEAIYAFKHPLTQEVAYRSQLAERRAAVHAAVARATIQHNADLLDERSALLAQHWEAAGEGLEAARWHARAATWSGTNDPAQSLTHWRRVQELADSLPEDPETTSLGLTARNLLLQFGWRLGISSEEAAALFADAERLASKAGDAHARAILLASYGQIKGISDGDLKAAADLTRQATALAEESGDPALFMVMAGTNAYALFCIGEFRESLATLDRALELSEGDPTLGAGVTVGCPAAFCHGFKGLVLVAMGRLDEARLLIAEGRRLAREQGDTETVGWCHSFEAWLHYFRGDPEAVHAHAQQFVESAERMGDAFSRSWAWHWMGWAEGMLGAYPQAVEGLERSLAISRDQRSAVEGEATRLSTLAEAHLGLGETDKARRLVGEALASVAAGCSQRYVEIDAQVALARILMDSPGAGARTEIEAALSRALEVARELEAKAYEPIVHEAMANLARLLGDEDERERELREAHRLFTEIGATGHAQRLTAELPLLAT